MTDGASTTGERAPSVAREPWQPATITAVSRLTSRVVSVTLRPERWRPFLAGQHVDVRLTAEDGYRTHRSYSIASPPAAEGTLELVIELLGDGEVSPFFHEVAAAGDTVEIRGPSASHFATASAYKSTNLCSVTVGAQAPVTSRTVQPQLS